MAILTGNVSHIFLSPTNPKAMRSHNKPVPNCFLIQPLHGPSLVSQRSTRTLEAAQRTEHPSFLGGILPPKYPKEKTCSQSSPYLQIFPGRKKGLKKRGLSFLHLPREQEIIPWPPSSPSFLSWQILLPNKARSRKGKVKVNPPGRHRTGNATMNMEILMLIKLIPVHQLQSTSRNIPSLESLTIARQVSMLIRLFFPAFF